MSFLKREEKKRLTAELVDELVSGPDPMDEMNKFATYDFIIMEGMTIGMLVLLSSIQDVVVAAFSFCAMILGFSLYSYYKNIKKHEAVAGKMFLEAITYIGEGNVIEQIEVQGWSLLVAPAETLDKSELVYEKDDLFETLTALKEPTVTVSGGPLHAPIIDEMAKVQTDRYIDEFKRREAEKHAKRKHILKKKKPKADISHAEDERDDLFDVIDSIDFSFLDEEEEEND